MNSGNRGGAELERVADQVLEELRELQVVRLEAGQRVIGDGGARLLDRGAQVADRAAHRALHRHGVELAAAGADAGVAGEGAVVVEDRLAGEPYPARLAAGHRALHLEVAERLVALEQRAVLGPVLLGEVERRTVPALAAEVRGSFQAGALAHLARHGGEAELRVLLPVPVRGEIGQAAKARLALALRGLGLLALA